MSAGKRLAARVLMKVQPKLLRHGEVLFRPLRRMRPVVQLGPVVVLTRHEDVRSALEDDDHFGVRYGERMEAVTGPFILGWDKGDAYDREVTALRHVVRPEDLPRVAALTRERATARLDAGEPLDAVALADDVTGAGLDRYFGLPELAGPGEREAARDVFRAVFLDGDDPAVMDKGREGSKRLEAAIAAAMARERAVGPSAETVVGRLLRARDEDGAPALADGDIPRNLVGLVAAWAASVPRAFALGLDVLLDHPAELARASKAAADGHEATVATLVLEALRLQPQAPFLARRCLQEVVLAAGSSREVRVRPGQVVIASTESAMRDQRVLDRPGAFSTARGEEEILHFGAGMHRCFGAAISETQFGALATALLEGGGLRRRGPLVWGPAFPQALPVAL